MESLVFEARARVVEYVWRGESAEERLVRYRLVACAGVGEFREGGWTSG